MKSNAEFEWLKNRVKQQDERIAKLERDAHPPAELRPAIVAILRELLRAALEQEQAEGAEVPHADAGRVVGVGEPEFAAESYHIEPDGRMWVGRPGPRAGQAEVPNPSPPFPLSSSVHACCEHMDFACRHAIIREINGPYFGPDVLPPPLTNRIVACPWCGARCGLFGSSVRRDAADWKSALPTKH